MKRRCRPSTSAGSLSDSIGRPDQYLLPYYRHDIEAGILTRDHAKELLQELFLTIHRFTKLGCSNDDKGGESHFAVGGYTIDHKDGFNELSDLIMEAMMDLPIVRPEVSLRWNKKTPFEVLKKMMDYERKDPFKRIAFVNDEPRLKTMQEILHLPWETAYDYIMVGCNEPAFQGGISLGGEAMNILRSMTDVFSKRKIPRKSIAIPTIAGGSFSPDFMYVVKKKDGTKELNLIVETKDVESETQLREEEQMKISCARIFFQNLEAEGYTVKFHAQLKREKMKQIIDSVIDDGR